MSDLIRVVDQELWTRIGVTDEERAQLQRLLISLDMYVPDIQDAASTDDIFHAVDYFAVVEAVLKFAGINRRKLIETFAEDLASELLGTYPIERIRIVLKKFILPKAAYVSIEIEREPAL